MQQLAEGHELVKAARKQTCVASPPMNNRPTPHSFRDSIRKIAAHSARPRRSPKERSIKSSVPLLQNKHYRSAPVFTAENLLREARRQKSLPAGDVPPVCVLDPDGDIVGYLLRKKLAAPNRFWACYHTVLHQFQLNGLACGIIGGAVGGPFAVLVAEQLFASGCQLLVSITSAGQILPVRPPPYFVLIEKALRDEGTSHHYAAPAKYARLNLAVARVLRLALKDFSPAVERGAAWTTDAPYRETAEAIERAKAEGILAVEMEAASLYAFAEARQRPVVCFAHITNRMGVVEGDFEKGEADGSLESLRLVEGVARCLRPRPPIVPAAIPTKPKSKAKP